MYLMEMYKAMVLMVQFLMDYYGLLRICALSIDFVEIKFFMIVNDDKIKVAGMYVHIYVNLTLHL